MANRSFSLCQKSLKNVFPSLSILTISLPAFSTHFPCPSAANVFSWLSHASNISLYFSSTFPSSELRALPSSSCTAFTPRLHEHGLRIRSHTQSQSFKLVVFVVYRLMSSSTFSKACVPGRKFDLQLCSCIHWSM
ncbi:unnamed protein product [Ectocarpus sp. 13 AM-2016]